MLSQFVLNEVRSPTINLTGLWHYPATITDATGSTIPFLTLGGNADFAAGAIVGVINNFTGREQMVFHTSFGTWSAVSQYLDHAWIHWGLRGMFSGYRRVLLGTQSELLMDIHSYDVINIYVKLMICFYQHSYIRALILPSD